MRQPFILPLALVTVMATLISGVLLMRSCSQQDDADEYSSFHRNPAHVVVGPPIKTDTELNEMWDGVGWLGKEFARGGELIHAYVETAWAIGTDKEHTYFVTCWHGPVHVGTDHLVIGYWNPARQDWSFIDCNIVDKLTKYEGDLVIMSVLTRDLKRTVKPLKIAKEQTFSINDEILIGGVQHTGGPAYVTIGIVKMINMHKPEFVIKGWAWYGFSGGPVRLRRSGEVIGYVRSATIDHVHDASESICGDFTLILKLLQRCGLENIVK
jgi:hypothetical protein